MGARDSDLLAGRLSRLSRRGAKPGLLARRPIAARRRRRRHRPLGRHDRFAARSRPSRTTQPPSPRRPTARLTRRESEDGKVRLFDSATDRVLATFEGHKGVGAHNRLLGRGPARWPPAARTASCASGTIAPGKSGLVARTAVARHVRAVFTRRPDARRLDRR